MELTDRLKSILDACYKQGVEFISFDTKSFELPCENIKFVTLWRNTKPFIVDDSIFNNQQTIEEPVYKDWYMTINYNF